MEIRIANIIQKRMKKLGITQGDLALQLGISQQSLSHWFTGRNQPRLDSFFYMLDLLGLNFELKEVEEDEEYTN